MFSRSPNYLEGVTLNMRGMDELKKAMKDFHRCYGELLNIMGSIDRIYHEMGLELNVSHASDPVKDDT